MKGLYIHIPFCAHICNYCDFAKKIKISQTQEDNYIKKIKEDLLKNKEHLRDIDTIYIGGGTPNALSYNVLNDLLQFIYNLDINYKEYSIELNPELLDLKTVRLLKNYGINRVSLGVQTFNERLLKLLGRKHTNDDVYQAIELLKSEGINNINIDLMFGIFTETIDEFKNDIKKFLDLQIPHLSCYSLILEENTMFNRLYKESDLDEDLTYSMMEYLIKTLKENNYIHYEISNFAKENFESMHNIKYWSKDEYIGIGMGATSYINHKRITNSSYINKYLKDEDYYIEDLTLFDEKKEFVILGLRKLKGISLNTYKEKYKTDFYDDFNITKLLKNDLIIVEDDTIRLSEKGLYLGNVVFEEFL